MFPSGQHVWVREYIRELPDFPKKGVLFRSLAPLLANPKARERMQEAFRDRYQEAPIDAVVGIASRGFVWATLIATVLEKPLVLACKKGKLPPPVVACTYELEYGSDCLEMEETSRYAGKNLLIVDDLLATGGTAKACTTLVEALGGKVWEIAVILDLSDLPWREALRDYPTYSLLSV
jgi:adenine phosphoribosyltransferase